MFNHSSLLFRLVLRRDMVRMIIWLLSVLALVVGLGGVLPEMYPTEAERAVMAETLRNPAMVAMMGPVYDTGGYTGGALFSTMMILWAAIVMAIMNIFFVVRHTRQDEESGRIEVIRSLPTGRLSNLFSVLLFAAAQNVVFGALIGLGLAITGSESMGFAGSMLFGAVMCVTGLMFAAASAVFCQLCASPRTASGLSFAFLVGMYMLRAAGDAQSELLACISPLGLILRTRVYTENLWWPVFVSLAITAGLAVLALYLCSIRDMGAGLIPPKPGRKTASPLLCGAGTLALRLMKTPIIIWCVTIVLVGAAYGSIMGDMEAFLSTNEMFKRIFPEADPTIFVSFLMVVMSIFCTIPVLQLILKAKSEEQGGFMENVAARAVSRYSQLWGYFAIALVTGVIMPVLTAVGFWMGSAPVMETPIAFSVFLKASAVYIPAIWFMLGTAVLLVGCLPRLAALTWAYLAYAFFVLYIGNLADLPEWMGKISPFGHIPKVPAEEFSAASCVVLVLLSAAMYAAGFIGYRNRDMRLS